MLGTIVNTSTIIAGSVLGSVFRQGIKENYKKALFDALGLATVALGANAVVSNMPQSRFPVLFILSLALGSIIGTLLDIDGRFSVWQGGSKAGPTLVRGCLRQYCFSVSGPCLFWGR
jgi:uncharacterized membrane protein YqgA involved in biofilm formation